VVKYDKNALAWYFEVVRQIDGNTRCTYTGWRTTRAEAREAVKHFQRPTVVVPFGHGRKGPRRRGGV
jgi:hypothetical protein